MVVYKKFFDKLTNTWIELPVQTDPSDLPPGDGVCRIFLRCHIYDCTAR